MDEYAGALTRAYEGLPYGGTRVVDATRGLAGAYASKLLADLGAEVVVADAAAHPMRDQALFTYLRTSQRLAEAPAADLVGEADIVLADRLHAPAGVVDRAAVTVLLSPLGGGGPDSELDEPEPVLQARCGSLLAHGSMTREPLVVGGRFGEWIAGTFAALGAATAWWRARRTGAAETVDVSMLEAMQLTFTSVPTLMARFPGGHMFAFRYVLVPNVHPTQDGYVGLSCFTPEQWRGLAALLGREEIAADESLTQMTARLMRADELNAALDAFTRTGTTEEIIAICTEARVPATPVGNGATVPEFEQSVARQVFFEQPGESWIRPRPPFRSTGWADPVPRAPEPGAPPARDGEARVVVERRDVGERPFAGVRIADFTNFWSGPFATSWFSALGADILKVEGPDRPDGIRATRSVPKDDPDGHEKSALFHAANLGKRDVALDLATPEGRARAEALIRDADIVAENYTPRVMEGFGLGWPEVHALNPRAIYLRIPAFGLDGPWRDRGGFATTMEQITGMAWLTGYADGPPVPPGGAVDPLVGAHAALALVAALEQRERTGEGMLVEVPMFEVAAAVAAEQAIAASRDGVIPERYGSRGVHRCEGDEAWVVVDVDRDPLAPEARAAWCSTRAPADAVATLRAEGIAAEVAVPGFATLDDPQLVARRFFTRLDHPFVGEQDYPGFPMRFRRGPEQWWTTRAPLLGEHTDESFR